MIRKRPKLLKVHDISLDPGAPTIDVFIDGVQIDSGSSVNLMNVDTVEELALRTMTTIPIVLRMAN